MKIRIDIRIEDKEMKTIYIVKMGAENSFTSFEWAFMNYEDAVKFREYIDKERRLGATENHSTIREMILHEDYPAFENN